MTSTKYLAVVNKPNINKVCLIYQFDTSPANLSINFGNLAFAEIVLM